MNAADAEATPVIAVHGGAWDWPDELDEPKLAGLRAALAVGHGVLAHGGSAVAGSTKSANPVSVARHVLEQLPECFYVGDGADAVAEGCGLADVVGNSLETPAMREYFEARRTDGPRDTVGAVAIDHQGRLASATSTSGTPYKPSGRVGDSAIFGAGGYAAAGVAAVGSTGNGEQIYRTLLAKYASDCVALGMSAGEAATAAADYFEGTFPASMSGVIIVDHEANIGSSHTAPKMAHGWIDRGGDTHTTVRSGS